MLIYLNFYVIVYEKVLTNNKDTLLIIVDK